MRNKIYALSIPIFAKSVAVLHFDDGDKAFVKSFMCLSQLSFDRVDPSRRACVMVAASVCIDISR